MAAAVDLLLDHDTLTLQDADIVRAALIRFRARPSLGFSDCLVLDTARKGGHLPLGTFDKMLARLEGVQQLSSTCSLPSGMSGRLPTKGGCYDLGHQFDRAQDVRVRRIDRMHLHGPVGSARQRAVGLGARAAWRWSQTRDDVTEDHVLLLLGQWRPASDGLWRRVLHPEMAPTAGQVITINVTADPGRIAGVVGAIDVKTLATKVPN